jgi:S1-C subfamily serine protease
VHIGATPLIGVDVCENVQQCEASGLGSGFGNFGAATNPNQKGAFVGGAVTGSPAAAAGIVAGDWIVGLAGHSITSPQALVTIKNRFHPGNTVNITWLDTSGVEHTAKVTFTSGPAD